MTLRDFPSPQPGDYRASPDDRPRLDRPSPRRSRHSPLKKQAAPTPPPFYYELVPSHGIGFQRKDSGISLGRKFRFKIGIVIRGKGRKKGIFGLVEIGFSKFIYVRQGCLVVTFLQPRLQHR